MNHKQFYISISVIVLLLRLILIPIITTDLAIWINEGIKFLNEGVLQSIDNSSLHDNITFNYPSKLSSIIFLYLYNSTSLIGVGIFTRLICFITGLYWINKFKDKINNLKNFFLMLPLLIGISFFMDRPACFGILLGSLLIPQLSYNQNVRVCSYLLFFILTVIWNNLHSSVFILFPLAIYQFLIDKINNRTIKPVIIKTLLVLVAVTISPIGFEVFNYVLDTILVSSKRVIPEWDHIFSFHYPYFTLLFIISSVNLLVRKYKFKLVLKDTLIIPLILLAIKTSRNMVWIFSLYPFFINQLDLWYEGFKIKSFNRYLNLLFISVLSLFLASQSVFFKSLDRSIKGYIKPELIKEIVNGAANSLFTESEIAGYVSLKTGKKIFIDSRNTIFSNKILSDYNETLYNKDMAVEILTKYKINNVLLTKSNYPLEKKLRSCKGWKINYEDKNYIYLSTLDIRNSCR